MPKNQKTTKTAKKGVKKTTTQKSAKGFKCPETHTLKNLILLWLCILAAGLLGVFGFAYLVPIAKENARASATSKIQEHGCYTSEATNVCE